MCFWGRLTGQSSALSRKTSLLSPTVPSTVPMMHQLSRAPDSITLSWPQPDRPNGDILEYQLRYYDKVNTQFTNTRPTNSTGLTECLSSFSLRVQMWTVQWVCTVRPTQWLSSLWFPDPSTPSRSELEMSGASAPTATPSTSPRCL